MTTNGGVNGDMKGITYRVYDTFSILSSRKWESDDFLGVLVPLSRSSWKVRGYVQMAHCCSFVRGVCVCVCVCVRACERACVLLCCFVFRFFFLFFFSFFVVVVFVVVVFVVCLGVFAVVVLAWVFLQKGHI